MTDDLKQALAAARLRLVHDQPYLASVALALVPVITGEVPTLAVDDRWRLYINPEFFMSLSFSERVGVLHHEVRHVLHAHGDRGRALGAEPRQWNLAADAEINGALRRAGISLPDCAAFPESLGQPDGLLAEAYYAALRQQQQGQSQPQQGQQQGQGQPQPGGQSGGQPGQPGGQPGQSGGQPGQPGHCAGGSGATGQPAPWELPDGSAPSVDRVSADAIRRRTAEQVRAAARQRGTVPGDLAAWADAVLAPARVDWRAALRAVVRRAAQQRAGRDDFSWARPSRRQAATPVRLPGMARHQPTVAVVLDTSGSMGGGDVAAALSEIWAVVRAVGAPCTLVQCDADVQSTQRVRAARHIDIRGGGGTDMRAGIAHALRLRPRPDVVVVLTDGYTPWPAAQPHGVRVIVALIGGGDPPRPPAWATVVRVEE